MSHEPDTQDLRASADAFVALIPCPFVHAKEELLTETHEEFWLEEIEVTFAWKEHVQKNNQTHDQNNTILGQGEVIFTDGTKAQILIEDPLPELATLAGFSPIPFSAAEVLLLREHQSIWRITVQSGGKAARRSAKRISQLFGTCIEMGACGIFLPGTSTLHAPRMIQKETMDLFNPQSVAQLFVSAWHAQGWMRTRGLTAFGLPEVELRIHEGVNSAFFHLMDVAANMLSQMAPYPIDRDLQIGHKRFSLAPGPRGPADEELPINGTFGVLTLSPRT